MEKDILREMERLRNTKKDRVRRRKIKRKRELRKK